jgi:HEAT repeat protein
MGKHTNHGADPDSPVHTKVVSEPGDSVSRLIQNLSSGTGVERERGRAALVALGGPAVGPLLQAFASADERGRLEICKALTEIADPAAIHLLIQCLEDHHQDLRWIAAEGLLNIGGPAVEPLLVALIDRASAHTILDGAGHVLRGLSRRVSRTIFDPVLAAVHGPEPGVSVPLAAQTALAQWRENGGAIDRSRFAPLTPNAETRPDHPWYDRRA